MSNLHVMIWAVVAIASVAICALAAIHIAHDIESGRRELRKRAIELANQRVAVPETPRARRDQTVPIWREPGRDA